MTKIDKAYLQPTNVASAGTTTPDDKVTHDDPKDDALGHPENYDRSVEPDAVDRSVKQLRDLQLGSNGMQSNGFSSKVADDNTPAPRRGFNQK